MAYQWIQNQVHAITATIFHKDAQNTHWRKRQHLQEMVLGKLNVHMQKNEIRPLSPPAPTQESPPNRPATSM